MEESAERWLPIPGYEGIYEFSNQYRVRRLARTSSYTKDGITIDRDLAKKLLTTSRNNGYLVAYLTKTTSGNAIKFYVEAAVENAFGLRAAIVDDITLPGESWKDIPGYEGLYQISDIGRVRSVGWYVNGGAKRRYARPKLLTVGLGTSGYPKVELAVRGNIKTISIHRLVATAFIPNPLNLEVVYHKDENKLNPRADNLEWVSRATNVQDWFDRRRVVVSTDTIQTILAASATGKTPSEILAALPRKRKPRKS